MLSLEKQVCALEYSKKLEKLGVKQESLFYWYEQNMPRKPQNYEIRYYGILYASRSLPNGWKGDIYCAFTVAELGVMLPPYIEQSGKTYWLGGYRRLTYHDRHDLDELISSNPDPESEANARALMVILLIEKNLITVGEINGKIN